MKRYIFAVVTVLVLFFAFGFYKLKQRKEALANLKPPQTVPFTVKAAKVKTGELKGYTECRGIYEPVDYGVLSPKVSGYVKKLYVREGDSFKKGEVLAEVDPVDLKSKLEAAKAKLEALKVSAQAAKTFLETQKLIYKRNERLFKNGGISKEQLQLSKSALEKAKAQYSEVLANLKATQEEIKNLEHNINLYSKVVAPYDGVVDRILVREGSFAAAGHPLMEIENTSLYRLLVEVPKGTKVGKSALVEINGETLTLKVSRVLPSSRGDLKIVEILTERLPIPSNSAVNVRLQTVECKGFIVPFRSLLYLDGGTFVVNDKKELIPVEVGVISGNLACVKGNLKPDGVVLVAGQYRLREIALHKYPVKLVF